MVDIAPSLYERVNEEFKKRIEASARIKAIKAKIEKGEANYEDANEYAVKVGEALRDSFKTIEADELPDGKMYYNIADRVVRPNMEEEYELVADVAEQTQKALNTKAGLGLNAVRPQIDQNRIQGIIDRISEAESYNDISWILGEPVVNYAQYVVDDSVKQNASMQTKAGLQPKIIRKAEAPGTRYVVRGKRRYSYKVPCRWCANLEGVYDYVDVSNTGNDVFRRHENCRCTVTYDPGDGRRQNAWSKKWLEPNQEEVNERIAEAERIAAAEQAKREQGPVEVLQPTEPNEAAEYYVSGEGMWINQYLRGRGDFGELSEKEKQYLKELDEVTSGKIPQGTLYRSVDAKAIFGDITPIEYENLQARLIYNDDNPMILRTTDEFMDVIGETQTEKGFLSTTKKLDVATEWGDYSGAEMPIVLEIKPNPKTLGVDLSTLDKNVDPSEAQYEVLLKRGQSYKINKIYAREGNIFVDVTMLDN